METLSKSKSLKSVNQQTKHNSSEELIKRVSIPDSPFTIVITKHQGMFVVMGKWRLTEPIFVNSEGEEKIAFEELEKQILQITWDRIIQVMMLIIADVKSNDELLDIIKPVKK